MTSVICIVGSSRSARGTVVRGFAGGCGGACDGCWSRSGQGRLPVAAVSRQVDDSGGRKSVTWEESSSIGKDKLSVGTLVVVAGR